MSDPIQDQLIAARKAQILDAATKVFAEKGFHPTTIKDIAAEAGIADGTIYNYFTNKTALLIAILDRMRVTIVSDADLEALSSGDLRTMIHAYVRHPLTTLRPDYFDLFRVVMSEIMVNAELRTLYYETLLQPTLQLAEMLFEDWAKQGLINAANIPLTIRLISSLILGLTMEYIMGDTGLIERWDTLPDAVTDLLLNGIASPRA